MRPRKHCGQVLNARCTARQPNRRRCLIGFSTRVTHAARPAALAAATGFVFLAGFQVFLALGGPAGRAAWGGAHDELSVGLRVASAFGAVLLVVAALVVLGRAGYWTSAALLGVFRWGPWVLVAATALSALANFASASRWENFLMGPIALVLAFLCLVVARGAES